MKTIIAIASLLILAAPMPRETRPIQAQGSSPYCLFAVDAYLADTDMWALAAEYHRRGLPTVDGLVPYNEDVLALIGAIHGTRFVVAPQWDTTAVRSAVQRGPVAVSGHGHALVLIAWNDAGRLTYLDSLRADGPIQMRDTDFWGWWDGWAWSVERDQ